MCIIAIKPAGIPVPAEEIRENMWDNNPDGGGYMVATGKDVVIRKGFMKFSEFEDSLKKEGDITDKTVVFHYRITTHGGTKAQNCHPFPISNNLNIITKPVSHTDIGVAHNGIINNVTPRKGVSDTMEYIMSQLSHMKKIDRSFYKKPEWLDLIEDAIDSKMVFLDKHGHYTTIGDFTEDNGVLYSNTSYKSCRFKGHYSGLGSVYGWDTYEDEWYDLYDYRKLMDLDEYLMNTEEETSDFVIIDTEFGGELKGEEYTVAIDEKEIVYLYDAEDDSWIEDPSLEALTDTGKKIKFSADLAVYCAVQI